MSPLYVLATGRRCIHISVFFQTLQKPSGSPGQDSACTLTHRKPLRCLCVQVLAQQLIDAAAFDTSRLVDFTESMQYNGAAMQLTPLVREAGCLAVTSLRIYFQPLHNVTSGSPVRVFALSDVAAMARRRSSLKPTGDLPCHDLPESITMR